MAGDNPDDLHVRTTNYTINFLILAIKPWTVGRGRGKVLLSISKKKIKYIFQTLSFGQKLYFFFLMKINWYLQYQYSLITTVEFFKNIE